MYKTVLLIRRNENASMLFSNTFRLNWSSSDNNKDSKNEEKKKLKHSTFVIRIVLIRPPPPPPKKRKSNRFLLTLLTKYKICFFIKTIWKQTGITLNARTILLSTYRVHSETRGNLLTNLYQLVWKDLPVFRCLDRLNRCAKNLKSKFQ